MPPSPPISAPAGGGGGMSSSCVVEDLMTPAKRSLSGGAGAERRNFPDAQQQRQRDGGAGAQQHYYGDLRIGGGGAVPSFCATGGVQPTDAMDFAALTSFKHAAASGAAPRQAGKKNPRARATEKVPVAPTPPFQDDGGGDDDAAALKMQAFRSPPVERDFHFFEPVEKKCRLSRSQSPSKKELSITSGCSSSHADTAAGHAGTTVMDVERAPSGTGVVGGPPAPPPPPTAATKLDDVRDLVLDVIRGGDPNIGGVREARRASIDVLVHVLSAHPSDGPVQEYCNAELFDMVHRDPRCAPAVVGSGPLLRAVVRGMEVNAANVSVQERACRTLWLLSVEDRHRAPVVASGACAAVAAALSRHGCTSETVAAAALGAIKPLSVHSKGRAALAGRDDCAASVASAMAAHPAAAKVQAEGCSVLSNLAVDMARRRVAVLSNPEMTAVLAAMHMHPASELVQRQACFALKNLSHQYENLARMVKCAGGAGSPEALLRMAADRHPETCTKQGQIVLQRLEHFRAGPVSVTSSGSIVSSTARRRRKNKNKKGSGGSNKSSRSRGSSSRKISSAASCASGCSSSSDRSGAAKSAVSAITINSSESSGSSAATVRSSSATAAEAEGAVTIEAKLVERPGSTSTTQSAPAGLQAFALGASPKRPSSTSTAASAPPVVLDAAALSNSFVAASEAARHAYSGRKAPSPQASGGGLYPKHGLASPGLSSGGGCLPPLHENSAVVEPHKTQAPRDPYADRLLAAAVELARRGDCPSALSILERCLASAEKKTSSTPSSLVSPRLLHCLGYVRALSGDAPGAVTCYERSVGILRRRGGLGSPFAADPEVAAALSSVGILKFRSGDTAGAEVALKESLDVKRTLAGRSNLTLDMAPELEALGDVKMARTGGGRWDGCKEAENLYKFAAACYSNAKDAKSSEQHDGALSSVLSKLGAIALGRGDLSDARTLLDIALDKRRASTSASSSSSPLGGLAAAQQSRELARALNDAGRVRVLIDDLEGAACLYSESVELQSLSTVGTCDASDAEFADTVTTLGVLRRRMDEPELARSCFEDALEVRRAEAEKTEGGRSEALGRVLKNLGEMCAWMGDDEASLAYNEEALMEVRSVIIHEEEMARAMSLENQATTEDDPAKIRAREEETARRRKKLIGLHDCMADLLVDVASVLARQGDVKSAREAYEIALVKKIKIYGNPAAVMNNDVTTVTVDILENLGYCCAILGNVPAAIDRYELSTKLRKRMLGPNALLDEDFAQARSTLGVLYVQRGSLTAAQESLKEALDIRRHLWSEKPTGETAGHVARSLVNLADAFCLRKKYDDAEALIEEALAILEDSCLDESFGLTQVAELQKKLGYLSGLRGDLASGVEHFQMALEATKANAPEDVGAIRALQELGHVLALKGEYDRSVAVYDESLSLLQEVKWGEDANSECIRSTLQTLNTLHKAIESGYAPRQRVDETDMDGVNDVDCDPLWEENSADQGMLLGSVGDMPVDFMEDFEFR